MTATSSTPPGRTVGDTGERKLLELLRSRFPRLGERIGDDAADLLPMHAPVATTDSFFEGSHFHRWWAPPATLGRRLLEATLSDVAAMAARPVCCLVALTLPADLRIDWLFGFYEGLLERRETCPVAGGEIIRGDRFGVTLTALGDLPDGGRLLRRSGVREGDGVYVAGRVGRALSAPALLERCGGLVGEELEPGSPEGLRGAGGSPGELLDQLRAFLSPVAMIEEAVELAGCDAVSAAIDISDGVLSEAGHLARESGVCVEVVGELLPLFDSVLGRPYEAATAGEDFVLMFSASEGFDECSPGFPVRRIGTARGVGTDVLWREKASSAAVVVEDRDSGYDHFGV